MNERKKIVRSDAARKNSQDKLRAALAKKPTAAFLNASALNAHQLKQISNIPDSKQKSLSDRLVRNSKNRKRFQNRPTTIFTNKGSYMDTPQVDGASNEFETPSWFKNTSPVDVSIIVPLYKSDKVIVDLIKTFPLNNRLSWEIVFIDDACPNKSRDAVLTAWTSRREELKKPVGKIILNSQNKGYGQACNAGVQFASGKYLIFLNADTTVTENWMEPMIELFNDPKVGLVGNMHLKEGGGYNGTIDSAGSEWRWPEMSFVHIGRHCYRKQSLPNGPYSINNCPKDLLEVDEREMVTGCCFAMTKKLFDYIGGFNPSYRIGYWEDSEICMNVRELGYKIMFQPNSIIHHKLGHTSSGNHEYFSANKQYFMNKWVNSHRIDNLLLSEPRTNSHNIKTILVKRTSAHGDALIAAGVCAGLKKKYPKAKILFSTMFPEIIGENPNIDKFIPLTDITDIKFDVFYNLDLCYEWRPNVNILTAYAEAVGVKTEDCQVYLNPQPVKQLGIVLPDEYIVIHAGKTNWVGRDWPHENFVELATRLIAKGENVVSIGRYSEEPIPCTVDARKQTSITETAWIIKNAKAFVGIDSLPMHIAQAVDAPGVSFFGSINPDLRIYTKTMKGITSKSLPCLGCHHRKAAPSTVTRDCEIGTQDCVRDVSVDQMWDKLMEIIN